MTESRLDQIRHEIRVKHLEKEELVVARLAANLSLTQVQRQEISAKAS